MKRIGFIFLIMGLALPVRAGVPSPASGPGRFLTDTLLARFRAAKVNGDLGLCVRSLRQARYEAGVNEDRFFTPASCLKVLVAAAAVDAFPLDTTFPTRVDLRGRLQGRTFRGSVEVAGGGDPNITGRFFKSGLEVLYHWADSVKALGIDTVAGQLTVSEARFQGPRRPSVWKRIHFNRRFGMEISALSFDENLFVLKVLPGPRKGGPCRVEVLPPVGYVRVVNRARTVTGRRNRVRVYLDPDSNQVVVSGTMGSRSRGSAATLPVRGAPGYFARAFQYALEKRGITFRTPFEPLPPDAPLLRSFLFRTLPLKVSLEQLQRRSDNFQAEMMLRNLGQEKLRVGSAEAGLQAERDFLRRMGVDPAGLQMVDGSGLSHLNRVTPRALVDVLAAMGKHPNFASYVDAMAIPGIHRKRLRAYGQVMRIKTGYIEGVEGLCGYLFAADGDTLAFSIFLNGFRGGPARAAGAVDSLAALMARWYNQERPSLLRAREWYADPGLPRVYGDRLAWFGKKLLGAAYFDGPTGEGRFSDVEAGPLLDLSRLDCVTYLEAVMALAASSGPDSALAAVRNIRYLGDTVNYLSRKHFFVEDWVNHSPDWVRLFRFEGDSTAGRYSGKTQFFARRNIPWSGKDPLTVLSFLPYDQALALAENWTGGKKLLGVGFVGDLSWLWVTHTGFVDATPGGRPVLRHASQLEKKVVEEDFAGYLRKRKGKCRGVMFFEFPERPVR